MSDPVEPKIQKVPPSLLSLVWPPAASALLIALILLVCLDVGLTALGSMRSQIRGDRIVDYQVDIVSRLSRIETAVVPPPPR